jgi:predicted RNase H-like HicB family nuclease
MAPKARSAGKTSVYLERGQKKVFACALDWPGWCRSGKTEEEALERLAEYAARYAVVAEEAGVRFPASAGKSFEVVERLAGTATTDFGAPGVAASSDSDRLTAAQAKRLAVFVQAAWTVLDRVAAEAPAALRKGPRGGGRDRDKMVKHVLDAESAYAAKIGVKHRGPAIDDKEAIAAMRADILAVLRKPSDGSPPRPGGWPVRYAARRFAWHALDHAWEMEDRSEPG